MSGPDAALPVRRRRLFYIAGFDPRSPGLYHILYRDESAKQAAALGGARTVGPAERIGREAVAWEVEDASGCRTRIEVLRWDDIVRAHWHSGQMALWRDGLGLYARMLRRGHVGRMARQAPWFAFTMVLPGLALAGMGSAMLISALTAVLLAMLVGAAAPVVAGVAAGAALAIALMARPLIARIRTDWILRALIFMRRHAVGAAPEMEARLDAWAMRVRTALGEQGTDEVIVAGHSVGAQLAVQTMARARASGDRGTAAAAVLTLGQVMPLAAWWSAQGILPRDLSALAADADVAWLDVTAPPDGACMALVDPVAACGLPPTGRPRRIPARFHRQFPPATYRRISRDGFRLHFQYLMAAEQAGGFDWFAVSAGPRPLSAWIVEQDGRHGQPA